MHDMQHLLPPEPSVTLVSPVLLLLLFSAEIAAFQAKWGEAQGARKTNPKDEERVRQAYVPCNLVMHGGGVSGPGGCSSNIAAPVGDGRAASDGALVNSPFVVHPAPHPHPVLLCRREEELKATGR